MIDSPLKPAAPVPSDKIVEVIENHERDDFGSFLDTDAELRAAYLACLQAAGTEWTDEEVAECVLRAKYGERVDDLMQAWRFRQELMAGDLKAVAVHIAVLKFQRRQAAKLHQAG